MLHLVNLPSSPKFSGVRGEGKLTVDIWLMQYLVWCEFTPVPLNKRVICAVQCLEGQAVQNWYNLRRQVAADGANVESWQISNSAMIKQYADVGPDHRIFQCVTAYLRLSWAVALYKLIMTTSVPYSLWLWSIPLKVLMPYGFSSKG